MWFSVTPSLSSSLPPGAVPRTNPPPHPTRADADAKSRCRRQMRSRRRRPCAPAGVRGGVPGRRAGHRNLSTHACAYTGTRQCRCPPPWWRAADPRPRAHVMQRAAPVTGRCAVPTVTRGTPAARPQGGCHCRRCCQMSSGKPPQTCKIPTPTYLSCFLPHAKQHCPHSGHAFP